MPMWNDNLDAYTTAGAKKVAATTAGSKGVTLANSTTYYIPIPPQLLRSRADIEIRWASAVVGTFTIETTDLPSSDVTDYDSTAGNWQQFNSPASYVPVTGSGNSASATTVTAGGSAAGACVFALTGISAQHMRIKAAITTGGLVRFSAEGKEG